MQKEVKKRHAIDKHGYELSKKVMRKLIEKEKSA
jgi:translation initiation factor IF-3